MIVSNKGMGDLLPCCDPSIGFFEAIFSNTCDYCSESQQTVNQQLMQNPNNQGNTSGIPCCDPSAGLLSSIFSNTCNLCNPVGTALGLSQIPNWAWVTGLGLAGLVIVRVMR